MYLHRQLETLLASSLHQFPALLITGPRQAGKSTLLCETLKNYTYVTLDDPFIRMMAQEDPELFLSKHETPLIIDEIQYAPHLFSYLKMRIDANRKKFGQFVLTGSQTFQVMKGVSESLAGRIAIFQLYPMTFQEIHCDVFDVNKSMEQIIRGFYPELNTISNINTQLWFGSYISTYIERDIRSLRVITDLSRFQTFIGLLAARAGKLLNMAELSKECGISQPTVKDWLSLLESTYIIYLLKPFHHNVSKRLVKSPKLYFVDTGLLCYLLGIDNSNRLLKSSEGGHVFENMVIMEILKQTAYRSKRCELFFYRTASGEEVDLLIQEHGQLTAFEIKFVKTLSLSMAKPLTSFMLQHKAASAHVLTLHEKEIALGEKISARHWSEAWNF